MKADALIRFMLLGNRSWEEFAILLARISLGAFFAISGGNKLFVAAHAREIYKNDRGGRNPLSACHGVFRIVRRIHLRFAAHHRATVEPVLHCAHLRHDCRDRDRTARHDRERTFVYRLA